MRRAIALAMLLCVLLTCVACGKDKADIPVEKLSWTLEEGTEDGHSYVFFRMTNNSDITVQSTVMTFWLKDSVTREQKDQLVKALQDSQGFSDAFMQDYLQKLEENGNYLNLMASVPAPLSPGAGYDLQRCYYMGGWTSKDLIFIDLFEPVRLTLVYEKDGEQWEQSYDFTTQTYHQSPVTREQQ